MRSRVQRLIVPAVIGLLVFPASSVLAADAAVTVTSVNGKALQAGDAKGKVKDVLSVDGTAVVPDDVFVEVPGDPIADAGDSQFVERGSSIQLAGAAFQGTEPFTFAWSIAGDSTAFNDQTAVSPVLDTTALPTGPVQVDLRVTDDEGRMATDSVLLDIWETTTFTLLNETVEVGPGLPDEIAGFGGTVDGESRSHPFTVSVDTAELVLELSWTMHHEVLGDGLDPFVVNDLDLSVDDPSDAEDANTSGATAAMPEVITIESPAAGGWSAIVDAFLNDADTYHLTATASSAVPANPLPAIASDGPFVFEVGQPQTLTATATGGSAPLDVAWDLDLDGTFETDGTTATTSFPVGQHLVQVKVTDAAGYELREVTPVRIVEQGGDTTRPGLVVVGIADTGINPYHMDWRAETYPDEQVLALTDNFTRHPSEYLKGFPADAPALNLALGDQYYPAADRAAIEAITPGTIYWIPGTKIVGAVDSGTGYGATEVDDIPLLDENGHGTASASVAVGNIYGWCPACLLAAGEGFGSDQIWYASDWVDIASNSWGAIGNIGFAGLAGAEQPVENAEAGQFALYAAGNGNENAFVTPQQTYTNENLGPDWTINVGAAQRSSRKPIIGTGKPVDVTSWGSGTIPSAGINSVNGTNNHSGTSAATPYTAGALGDVLRRVRGELGTTENGFEDGIVASGRPVTGSPYLGDGVLTRAELQEALFKTAEHDTSGTVTVYPATTPNNPYQYLIEGYGIVEPASADRAFDVLMGAAPMPERPAEDEFFAQDEWIRDSLWGDWDGGAGPGGAAAAPAAPLDPVAALAAATDGMDAVLGLMADTFGPAPLEQVLEARASQQAGTDVTYWLHYLGPCDGSDADDPHMSRQNTEGDVDGCGGVGTASLVGADVQSYSAREPIDVTVPAGTAVNGVVYLETIEPAMVSATATLLGTGGLVGQGTSEAELTLGAVDILTGYWLALPFEFTTDRDVAVGESLTLSVRLDTSASWQFGYEDDHASFFTMTVDGSGGGGDPDPTGPSVTITAPQGGTIVDPAVQPTLTVSGTYSFPTTTTPADVVRHYPRRDSCGGDTDNLRLTQDDGPDGGDGCGFLPGASVLNKVVELRHDFPLVADETPVTLDADTASGTVYVSAEGPSPLTNLRMELSTLVGGFPQVIASQSVQATVVGAPVEGDIPFDFAIDIPEDYAGIELANLTFSVVYDDAQGGIFVTLDDPASYIDLPLADMVTGAGDVQVSVDDETFGAPITATLGTDGTFAADVNTTALADGDHTVYVRAVQDGQASVSASVTFTVARGTHEPGTAAVHVQVVPEGGSLSPDGWRGAVDTSADGDWTTWSYVAPAPPKGDYTLYARLVVRGEALVAFGPVAFKS